MKIHRLNDHDWIAAESLNEAMGWYARQTGLTAEEAFEDPRELTDEEMDRLMFEDETGAKLTFRQQLDKIMEEPGRSRSPFHFASTEV